MEDKPFFSIVVPVYNVEAYLDECIHSVFAQTFSSYEIILVDDGSTDRSGEICDRYAEQKKRTVHVIHKDNHGLSSARNAALPRTVGEYVLFLDSDDILLDENVLQGLHDRIQDEDMVIFEWKEFVTGQDWHTLPSKVSFHDAQVENKTDAKDYLLSILSIHAGMPWYPWMYAYKNAYMQEKKLSFLENHLYEDVLFTPRALLGTKSIGVYTHPVYGYRIRRPGATTMTVKLSTMEDMLYAASHNIEWASKDSSLSQRLQELLCSNFSMLYFSVFINYFGLKSAEERKILRKDLKEKAWIMDYMRTPKQVWARRMLHVFGFLPTAFLLDIRRRVKEACR